MNVIEFDAQCQQWVQEIEALRGYVRVVDDSHAVNKLNDKLGIQLVAVLPSYQATGISGAKNDSQNTLFWVIEKWDPSHTDAKELDQYARTEEVAHALKDKMIQAQENGCSPFWRLEISSITLDPDYNAFGGWNGWMMTVSF
jgi:hypothetical protein